MANSSFTVDGVSGSGGAFNLISSQTALNSASISFTGLTTSYSAYKLIVNNLLAGTAGTTLLMRSSTNNGVSFDSGANYAWAWADNQATVSAPDGSGSSSDTSIHIFTSASASAGKVGNYDITLYSPATSLFSMNYNGFSFVNGGNWYWVSGGGTYFTGGVNAIQFLMSSGNIAAGNFYLYGILA